MAASGMSQADRAVGRLRLFRRVGRNVGWLLFSGDGTWRPGLDRARCGHQMTFPQGPTRRTWDPGTAAGRAAFPVPCPGSLVFARTLPAMDDETNDPCWRPPSHDGDALQNLRARGALVITRLDRLGLSSSAPWSPSAPRSANATSACALCAVRWLTFGNRDGCLRSDHRVGHPARGGKRAGRVRVAASPDQVAGRASPSVLRAGYSVIVCGWRAL